MPALVHPQPVPEIRLHPPTLQVRKPRTDREAQCHSASARIMSTRTEDTPRELE
jgi:hypothetical protein